MLSTVEGFFNKLAQEIDKKYFPNVKYYRDDKNDAAVHYAVELFNNGCLTYEKLIKKLCRHCNDTEENIKPIVDQFIVK